MNCMTDDQMVLFQMIDWPNEAQVPQVDVEERFWELDHLTRNDGLVEEERRPIHLL
jgi:hypothetical protein